MNNNRNSADINLTIFGGLCTEVAPTDLPEGASPLNWDVDFDIGSVYTRSGLTPVFSYENLATGPNLSHASGWVAVNNRGWAWNGTYDVTTWPNGQSPIQWWNGFGYDLDPDGVTGIEVAITGHYTGSASPECVLELTLSEDGRGVGVGKIFYFKTNDTTVTLGGPHDTWAAPIAVKDINQASFGVQFYGISPGQTVTLYVQSVTVKIYSAQGQNNINWLKTFIEDNGHTHSFVLDSQGTLWEEDLTANPGVLAPQLTVIPPNTFAFSATQSNDEWIAFSDLQKGTAIPRHGFNFDRISQVGPGAGPQVVGLEGTGPNATTWNISTIIQDSQAEKSGVYNILWSAGPGQTGPGNVLTIYYEANTNNGGNGPSAVLTQDFQLGGAVQLNYLPGQFAGLNGTYKITSMGYGVAPGGSGNYWYFTVQTQGTGPSSNNYIGYGGPNGPYVWRPTMATMTLPAGQPANIVVGQQISIQDASVAGFDGSWTVLNAQNGGQYTITATSLASGVATYSFQVIGTSPQPTVGALVTVTGALNGPILPSTGASVFDVVNAPIQSVSGGEFTVAIPGAADVSSAAETQAQAIVSGTVYQFDPGLNFLGTIPPNSESGFFGSSTGGQVTIGGDIGAGVRKAVTLFQTRNGYVTAPSPPTIFETTTSANSLVASNIAIGPANVIKRIIAFTPAGGGFYFYIPEPVKVTGVGQVLNYSATVVNDNTSQQATFTFTDAVLMGGISIDSQGNNLFNQIEIGSSCAIVPYAERNFYLLQDNKVQNFVNTTFDGGYLGSWPAYPLGWTPEPNINASGGHLNFSPIFGFSYYISNTTSATAATLGAIHQGAYQDAYQVPILNINVQYSIRAWLRAPSGITTQGGQLFLDIVSYSTNTLFGSVGFDLSQMTPQFQEFTAVLTGVIQPVSAAGSPPGIPTDTVLRLYAVNLPPGADVEIDRFEIFPTEFPQLTTKVYGSYVANLEAVDGISGNLDDSVQNNQPTIGAFTQYDILYLLKSKSMFSTQDSPSEEPGAWKIREVSNKVGTCGIHAYDYGEEWMLTANRLGIYIFSGTEPVKISQEIQNIWDAINWKAGYTIVLRNDVAGRRFFVHIPLPTPNPWLPDATLNANPVTPNVMLMCNYKELQTSAALSERGPVKLSFSGRLISWDMSRKWSLWQIPSPYSDFILRPNGTDEYSIGNGRQDSKVYRLDPNALSDDSLAINGLYTTYGFIRGEQAQQFGPLAGQYRKLYKYSSYNLSGAGVLKLRALANNLMPSYPYVVPGGIQLTCPVDHYREVPFNLEGQRLFLEFSTNDAKANFRLSEIILSLVKSAWAPVRGVN